MPQLTYLDLIEYANKALEEAKKWADKGDYQSAAQWIDEYAVRLKAAYKLAADVAIQK